MTLEQIKAKSHEAMAAAKKADSRHTRYKKVLKSFPLWKRLVFFLRFQSLRKKLKDLEWARFGSTIMALNLSKLARRIERNSRARQNSHH